jgi:secreted Zn-dependent insulinase-like peptidase
MMQENVWLPQERLLAAETITAESFIKRAQSSLMKRKITSYVHGSMNQEDALSLNDQCIDALAVNDGEAYREDLIVNEEGNHIYLYRNIYIYIIYIHQLELDLSIYIYTYLYTDTRIHI